jgi:uncharacterized protein (TIGR02099 family)
LRKWVFKKLVSGFWITAVTIVVVVAFYVSVGRYVASVLPDLKQEILALASDQTNWEVEVDTVNGSWEAFAPSVVLEGMRLMSFDRSEKLLEVSSVELGLDLWSSIVDGSPRFRIARVVGMNLEIHEDARGGWQVPGFESGGSGELDAVLRALLNVQRLELIDISLTARPLVGEPQTLRLGANIEREDDFRRLHLGMNSEETGTSISVLVEGIGDPLVPESLSARGYVAINTDDARVVTPFLSAESPHPQSGALSTTVWVNWDGEEGDFTLEATGSDLKLEWPGTRRTPAEVENLAFVMSGNYGDDGSHLRLHEGSIKWQKQTFELPQIQLDQTSFEIHARIAALELQQTSHALQQSQLISEVTQELLIEHNPVGRLEAIQIDLLLSEGNVSNWQYRSNLVDLGVTAVKAIPGVKNASGYVEISAVSGRLDLDSTDIELSFPRVYSHDLGFDSLLTQLRWEVSDEQFELRSGPIIAEAEEGPVRALFGLSLARGLESTGPEMNLMVGLKDTNPSYRSKYLPYTLSDGLLNWLETSIEGGLVSEGAFLWRGALRKDLVAHRTVQLFFDVINTSLIYDPAWPKLEELDGLVVVDDSEVTLTTSKARILQTPVTKARVTLAPERDSKLMLRVDAETLGRAEDGLQVVNESALRDIVGDTFKGWKLDGQLRTRLRLGLDLGGGGQLPEIDLSTTWSDVDLEIPELGLRVEQLTGDLLYSSKAGFSERDLGGLLWGEQLVVDVQHTLEDDRPGPLDINFGGEVDSADVREWLGLDLLKFVDGKTSFDARLTVSSGIGTRFILDSDLQGLSFDAPLPISSSDDSPRSLRVEMPLGKQQQSMELTLDDSLKMHLLLQGREYLGGAIQFGATADLDSLVTAGLLNISGSLDELEVSQWQEFIRSYLVGEDRSGDVISADGSGVAVIINDLSIASLRGFGQTFEDVVLSGRQDAQGWYFEAETDWMRGGLDWTEESIELALDRIDLDGLIGNLSNDVSVVLTQDERLPAMTVSIAELERSGKDIGSLNFNLADDGKTVTAAKLSGELYGLKMSPSDEIELVWSNRDELPFSRIKGQIGFDDFGDVLDHFNYERFLQTSTGSVDLDLTWPGSPFDAKSKTLNGTLGFSTGTGAFLKTSNAASGTLKVLGVLNLAGFVQRADLSIGSLFSSGISFDDSRGGISFSDGVLEIGSIDVNGRASSFDFAGSLDLQEEIIGGELVVTLPIGSNLPWMAAVVAGLPIAAGVFVVSKVFQNQVDSLSSIVYEVAGPMSEPRVVTKKIFDNSRSKNQAVVTTPDP